MAACIKMPLGMELGLGPGDFVLDGDPASGFPPQKGGRAPPKFKNIKNISTRRKKATFTIMWNAHNTIFGSKRSAICATV